MTYKGVFAQKFLIFLACTLTACTPVLAPTTQVKQTATAQPQPATQPAATHTARPTETPTTSPAPTDQPPTDLRQSLLCSPLEDIRLDELGAPDLLKNPFLQPSPGTDDGHHGADFAYWSRGEHKEMLGLPVKAALRGQVAAVIPNRQPYGYAVILETPLNDLPADWKDALSLPQPVPTAESTPRLVCPAVSEIADLPVGVYPDDYSLYLLYAHLNEPPPVSAGQAVECGHEVGKVGTTGRSVNAHLHLETRLGPAGASFTSLAHYQNDASEVEMGNYCAWRVSGLFQLFDPVRLLSLQP